MSLSLTNYNFLNSYYCYSATLFPEQSPRWCTRIHNYCLYIVLVALRLFWNWNELHSEDQGIRKTFKINFITNLKVILPKTSLLDSVKHVYNLDFEYYSSERVISKEPMTSWVSVQGEKWIGLHEINQTIGPQMSVIVSMICKWLCVCCFSSFNLKVQIFQQFFSLWS